ncbi:MAG: thioredoxin domain-containing protein [Deltaproteobacteria bacterium]|nr:thioredoxin domain-containing protein [Deltaproteobacteria bacterium]
MSLRSPEEIRKNGNHLSEEGSLYLRQHAHNPIDWHPWNEESLKRAVEEDKPIFLSIGYASCHWCHVMEHEVFEHDDVAAFMNEHFVSIKVDREERPDLDAIYMDAVQLLTGGGGWPMTVFLTPSLQPFFGGTYFPHDAFLSLAERIHEVFGTRRQDVEQQGHDLARAIASGPAQPVEAPVTEELVREVARQGKEAYDERYGGFRARQKFPTPLRWAFLLHHYRKTGDEAAATRVRHTLDAMAAGGLRDQVGGGFHRYTVDPIWLVPHFEKMLYDNAQMASLYLEASCAFASERYAGIARDTLEFLLRDMAEEAGGFSASWDADNAGKEGEYYAWTPAQIEQVAGAKDGPALAMLLGATVEGNFEGSNVLTLRADPQAVARRFDRSADEVAALFDRWRPALLQARASRTPPARDRKVVTSWNGLALAAFAQAHSLLGGATWLPAALRTAAFLWSTHRKNDGTLVRASNGGVTTGEGILDDYAFLAWGLLELHQATGEVLHVQRARELVDHVLDQFSHPAGGFYLTSSSAHAPLGRKVTAHDSVEPSGQAMMLQCMLRLAALTGDQRYRTLSEEALRANAQSIRTMGMDMAWWADAALRWLGPYQEVVIAGDGQALARTVRELAAPHVVLLQVPDAGPEEADRALLAPTQGKIAQGGKPTAYVCRFGTCQAPTGDPGELRKQVLEGWYC